MSYNTLPETEPTSKCFRRGDVREDGKIFWTYQASSRNGEYWVNQERFEKLNQWLREYKPTRQGRRKYDPESCAKWRRLNQKRINEYYYKWHAARVLNDPLYAIKSRVRARLHMALRNYGVPKRTKTAIMLGCSWEELKQHLENQFLPGMSWDNRSEWHIDHIVPLSRAETEQDLLDLSHHSNLRPLWKKDNLLKSDSLPPRELVPEHLLRFIEPSS